MNDLSRVSALLTGLILFASSAYSASLNNNTFSASTNTSITTPDTTSVRQNTDASSPSNTPLENIYTNSVYFSKLIERQLSGIDHFKYYRDRGGWASVDISGYFRKGDEGEAVAKINTYLGQYSVIVGLDTCDELKKTPNQFSQCTQRMVEKYQTMHGLTADGIVGPSTLNEMRKSIDEKIAELSLNLERMQEYANRNSRNMILINISDYSISFIRNGETFFQSKVIVGTRQNQTEILSERLSYFVVNPQWNIPPSIVNEIAPKVIDNPNYLAEKNIVVYEDGYHGNKMIAPENIDWQQYVTGYFPYYMVQTPGDDNPLGRVKYMFPNHHSIYVHDTSNRQLFSSNNLMRSHGCIRMKDPFQLAEAIAKYDLNPEAWSTIRNSRWNNESVVVSLNNPIEVHVVYWTAWMDETHRPQFRQDIYRNDIALKQRHMNKHKRMNIATN